MTRTFATIGINAICILAAIGCGSESRVPLGTSDPPAVLGASLSDYAGSWEGYVEAHKWGDQTDFIRLQLNGDGRGVLQVGSPDAPELDISKDIGSEGPIFKPSIWGLAPGFDYDVSGAVVTARRIQLGTATSLVYVDWCEGFEPIADAANPGTFNCAPNLGFSWDNGDPAGCRLGDADRTPYPCADLACIHACSCTETSCTRRDTASDVLIDAALMLEGEELAGTLLMMPERFNIRMVRSLQ